MQNNSATNPTQPPAHIAQPNPILQRLIQTHAPTSQPPSSSTSTSSIDPQIHALLTQLLIFNRLERRILLHPPPSLRPSFAFSRTTSALEQQVLQLYSLNCAKGAAPCLSTTEGRPNSVGRGCAKCMNKLVQKIGRDVMACAAMVGKEWDDGRMGEMAGVVAEVFAGLVRGLKGTENGSQE